MDERIAAHNADGTSLGVESAVPVALFRPAALDPIEHRAGGARSARCSATPGVIFGRARRAATPPELAGLQCAAEAAGPLRQNAAGAAPVRRAVAAAGFTCRAGARPCNTWSSADEAAVGPNPRAQMTDDGPLRAQCGAPHEQTRQAKPQEAAAAAGATRNAQLHAVARKNGAKTLAAFARLPHRDAARPVAACTKPPAQQTAPDRHEARFDSSDAAYALCWPVVAPARACAFLACGSLGKPGCGSRDGAFAAARRLTCGLPCCLYFAYSVLMVGCLCGYCDCTACASCRGHAIDLCTCFLVGPHAPRCAEAVLVWALEGGSGCCQPEWFVDY